jgi:uncharacterized membrane protein YsdA (DUF1294 family)
VKSPSAAPRKRAPRPAPTRARPRPIAPAPARRSHPAPPRHTSPTVIFVTAAAAVAALVVALGWHFAWPPLLVGLLAVNAATFGLYAYDKAVAGRNRLRVPERVLHALALLGGTVAALCAQRLLRHKVSKYAFQRTFWILTLCQGAALGAWILVTRL